MLSVQVLEHHVQRLGDVDHRPLVGRAEGYSPQVRGIMHQHSSCISNRASALTHASAIMNHHQSCISNHASNNQRPRPFYAAPILHQNDACSAIMPSSVLRRPSCHQNGACSTDEETTEAYRRRMDELYIISLRDTQFHEQGIYLTKHCYKAKQNKHGVNMCNGWVAPQYVQWSRRPRH